jgi:hypothetical protein
MLGRQSESFLGSDLAGDVLSPDITQQDGADQPLAGFKHLAILTIVS